MARQALIPLHRAERGFTAIELLTVIAIVAILSTIAAPSFTTFIGTMNSRAAATDLTGDLSFARSESLKRNESVTVVPVADSWSKGWQVRAADGTVLRSRPEMKSSLEMDAPVAGVTFLSSGRINADEGSNQTWKISSKLSGVQKRCIVVTPTGTARVKMEGCT